jgi:hypothetical protein
LLTIQADGNVSARSRDVVGIKVNSDSCHLFTEVNDAVPRAFRNPLVDAKRPTTLRPTPAPRHLVEEAI